MNLANSIKTLLATCVVLAGPLLAGQANAEGMYVDEFRFGGTWAQPTWLDANHPEGSQAGINAEVLFAPFDFGADPEGNSFLNAFLTPRFHIGGVANLDDDGTSYAYAGLTWHYGLTEKLFVEASFGGSVNNGSIDGTPTRAHLGSKVLFRESIALGYQFTPNVNVLLQLDHNSHRELASDKNRGLSSAHMIVGYKF